LIGPESKEFLVFLFTDLRQNLDERGPRASEEGAIFDALLDGLSQGFFPDDEKLREYVAGLKKSTDKENEYERVSLEHRALGELGDALAENQ
jgi:hypothetical protein